MKLFEKKFWKQNVGKNFWKQNIWKFGKKNFGKINYKTKIFITKIYSNIDKCHIIFVFRQEQGKSNKNVCGICTRHWFKIGDVALALHERNVTIWTRSEEKIYHGLRAVGNPLTTWAVSTSSVVRSLGLAPTMKRRALSTTKKSNVVHQLSYEFTGVNTSALILGSFRESKYK